MDTMGKIVEIMQAGGERADKFVMAVNRHYKAMREGSDPEKDYTETLKKHVKYQIFIRDVKSRAFVWQRFLNQVIMDWDDRTEHSCRDGYKLDACEIGNLVDMLDTTGEMAEELFEMY